MRSRRYDPRDCLLDIIENAGNIAVYLQGIDLDAFHASHMTRDAVERCLERICEAVYRIADLAEKLMPGQPYSRIRGMGNRLRHGYDEMDLNVVYHTARETVPALAVAAQEAYDRLQQQG